MGKRGQLKRLTAGRPTNFPSVLNWLGNGVARNLRGSLTALVAAWFYIPAALVSAATLAVAAGF